MHLWERKIFDVQWHEHLANISSPSQSDGEEPTSPTPAEDPETTTVAADAPAAGGSSQMASPTSPNTHSNLPPPLPPFTAKYDNPQPQNLPGTRSSELIYPNPPTDHPRRPQRRPEARTHPRRPRPRAPRSLQGARQTTGAHVRAQRGVRGGGLQEARGGVVRGAFDSAYQRARWETVGRVGWVV